VGQHQKPDQAKSSERASAAEEQIRPFGDAAHAQKTAVTAIEGGTEESVEAIRVAVKRIDRAAAKGVIPQEPGGQPEVTAHAPCRSAGSRGARQRQAHRHQDRRHQKAASTKK